MSESGDVHVPAATKPGRFNAHARTNRYLSADVPGVGGVLRERPEDFLVEEIPAYEPTGEGEHLYLFIEKRNMSTLHMMRLVAEHFGVRRDAVGVAGLKDKRAITRQAVSVHIPGKATEGFASLRHELLNVEWAARHTNKLRRGHLKGNRFVIRIRGVEVSKVVHAKRTLERLARQGTPNRAGEQRFGFMGNNHLIGRAIVLGDARAVVDEVCGFGSRACEAAGDVGLEVHSVVPQRAARTLYHEGKHLEAFDLFPRSCHTERRVLAALARGASPSAASRTIERLQQSFYVSAFQSALFNRLLEQRLTDGTFDRLLAGDVAFKHENGSAFSVTDEVASAPQTAERLARLEISPTGPMWGPRMMEATGAVGLVEQAALESTGVTPESLQAFARRGVDMVEGARRPFRVPLTVPDIEAGVDEHGPYIKCRFELPRGAFATVVMDEIMKVQLDQAESESAAEDDQD